LAAPAEVEDVRRVVKDAAKAVAAESLDDRVALALGIFLDRGAQIAQARARLDRLDAASSWTRR
jgi:6,7-dimethyl-8-ribityllumazine synthase